MSDTHEQRRLATILIADVVGYSRLIGADEAGTLSALRDRRKKILEPLVSEHGGRIVKFLGDGALVEFSSAVNAVQCAVLLQKRMAEANESVPESRQITLRIGINLGDVVPEGADIFGDGVNIAARLEPLARPGELCIAANVYDVVRTKLDLSIEDLGEVQLKNIAQPVRAFRVSVDGARCSVPVVTLQSENPLSIAVLPFDNMSGVPEQGYIGDGIAENILTDLSRFHDLTVIARNSSFAYKGKATRVQDIRRDLGVNYVVEGSIQRAGDRIRVTAQLIDGATGKHLWAERYDRRADDLFAVMDEITELIVGALGSTKGGRLRRAASNVKAGTGPTDFRAFDHFVQGMQALDKNTQESIALGLMHLSEATALNPHYAKAHAKIAWAHLLNRIFGWCADPTVSLEQARAAANAAVTADEAEAWAHWALAGCALACFQHDRALSDMKRALELNPSDADVLTDMGIFCAFAGKAEEGLIYALKGMRLNPHYPEYYADQLGQIYFVARQYENAIRTFDGIRTYSSPAMLVFLAASHVALGHQELAGAAVAKLLRSEPLSSVSYWTSPNFAPFREERDREHLAVNLRLAGLPE